MQSVTPCPIQQLTAEQRRALYLHRQDDLVGFWRLRQDEESPLPWPADHCDPSMPASERERVAVAIEALPVVDRTRGESRDRLTGERIRGNGDRVIDGMRMPQALSHYVRVHGLRLPERLLAALGVAPADEDETIDAQAVALVCYASATKGGNRPA